MPHGKDIYNKSIKQRGTAMTASTKKHIYLATVTLMSAIGLAACADKPAEQSATADTQAQTSTTEAATPSADAVAPTGDITIKTATGDVTIAGNPHPLAVYDMTAMQNLAVLGVPVEGMPADLRLTNLKAANTPDAAEIGTVLEPNLEALNALQPKAIIVGSRMAEKAEIPQGFLAGHARITHFRSSGLPDRRHQKAGKILQREQTARPHPDGDRLG